MSTQPLDPMAKLGTKVTEPEPAAHILEALRNEMKQDSVRSSLAARSTLPQSRNRRALLSLFIITLSFIVTTPHALMNSPIKVVSLALCYGVLGSMTLLLGGVPGNMRYISQDLRKWLSYGLPLVLLLSLGFAARYFASWSEYFSTNALLGPATAALGSCLRHSFFSAGLCTVGLLAVWKRTDPFAPGITGALFGVLGGLLSAFSIELGCHNEEGLHLTLGHGVATTVWAILGYFAGRKWLTP